MKKLSTLLIVGTIAFILVFGLTACGEKPCKHIYIRPATYARRPVR